MSLTVQAWLEVREGALVQQRSQVDERLWADV